MGPMNNRDSPIIQEIQGFGPLPRMQGQKLAKLLLYNMGAHEVISNEPQ